jgi:flotillin
MAIFGIQLTGLVVFAIFLTLMGIVGAFAMFARRYQKVPPDKVLVVYGRRSTIKVRDASGAMQPREVGYRFVQGGGTFILPVLEKFAWLNLSTHTVEPIVEDVVTQQGVPLTVEGVAQIKIKSDTVSVATAAEQLLGKDDKEITTIAQKTLEGHIRGVCATLTVEAINADRAALSAKIQEEAVPDFERLGLEITTFTIKDIKDRVNYLTSLGERRTAEVKRDAAIGKAQAEREATIKVAEAKKDQEVASAKALQQDRVIGVTQAEKEGAVAKAAREAEIAAAVKERDVAQAVYSAEVEKARADKEIAFQIQSTVRSKELEAERVQVAIVRAEKEAELREREIVLAQKQQEAQVVVPARKQAEALAAQAEGEKRQISIMAEGRAAELRSLAEGKAAEIRALAGAEAERTRIVAEAEAQRVRLLADAEAERVRKVGEAEAAAMKLKADAYQQFGEAAKLDIVAKILPEMTESMAKSLQNTEKVIVITGHGGGGELPGMVASGLATIPTLVKGLTGQSVTELLGSSAAALRGEGGHDPVTRLKPKDK